MNKSKVLFPEPEEHPSYGAISVSRITSSGGVSLFGSSIKHNSFIRLRIHKSQLYRNHHEDRHSARDPIIEVDMSPVQFAEMIASIGLGEGISCTIHSIRGESIPEPQFTSKREQFVAEFQEHTDDIAARFDEVIADMKAMIERGKFGKKDQQDLLAKLKLVKQAVECDTPFIASQFNEQMDKTVHEAKGEVEAFIANMVHRTGLESIKRGQIALE